MYDFNELIKELEELEKLSIDLIPTNEIERAKDILGLEMLKPILLNLRLIRNQARIFLFLLLKEDKKDLVNELNIFSSRLDETIEKIS